MDLQKYQSVSLYGAGTIGEETQRFLSSINVQVNFFLDQKKKGNLLEKKIISPSKKNAKEFPNVIISIFNAFVDIDIIVKDLKMMGYNVICSFTDIYYNHSNSFPDKYWLVNPEVYISNKNLIDSFSDLLSDNISKNLLEKIYDFRTTGDSSYLSKPDLSNQYFPNDISNWLNFKELRFMDIGGYDGDTILNMYEKGFTVDHAIIFEPDTENLKKLVKNVRLYRDNLTIIPNGVFSKITQLSFNLNQDGSSSISNSENNNSVTVQCLDIDSCFYNFKPNFIKMDIEGAELEALKGASETIIKHKPNLAISLYHKPQDLWEIPNFIKSLRNDYKFYLRSHGHLTFDSVLYCI